MTARRAAKAVKRARESSKRAEREERRAAKRAENRSPKLARGIYFAPGQDFFHCRTGTKIQRDEVALVDSDDDVDESWIQVQGTITATIVW